MICEVLKFFFFKFVTSKITIFFFTLFLYCYCKTATIWCRIWCLKSIDRGMITVCSMWFLKSTIGCLKFKCICKSVFVHRQQRNITFCTIICFERERGGREREFFFIDIIWFFSETHAKPVPYEYQQYQGSFLFIKNKKLVNALVLSYPKDNLS